MSHTELRPHSQEQQGEEIGHTGSDHTLARRAVNSGSRSRVNSGSVSDGLGWSLCAVPYGGSRAEAGRDSQ